MYYVNRKQIETILGQIPDINTGLRGASASWDGGTFMGLVQERCLHLAIEVVTDVGSSLIDGFIMRDAGSYEDIISIIHEEKVFAGSGLYDLLIQLVALRKPLVQDYYVWDRTALHPLAALLPEALEQFAAEVRSYLDQELGAQAPV
ncbi:MULTISPECIES: DUF86 domain-containing protein [Paenibacillus]|uniref:DUF86 domain-containing protein n=1 Tax=Paenibacillus helianthi TaxID=1349432 RepID=A0ABX3EIS8_9BACL|nr:MULTISPECIES: HepT-like ribonuclease domain-containing protein [Paenibacillus]OKP80655.1 hypothetical protein A3844_26550 [Paenibacillus helianthi]OKP84994.1 hypothetical protein A3842_07565 [Paenibacillus sp. P3E]OKP89065.1 hypothetical protein A3848_16260 [Paenibacillus sp. P32E]